MKYSRWAVILLIASMPAAAFDVDMPAQESVQEFVIATVPVAPLGVAEQIPMQDARMAPVLMNAARQGRLSWPAALNTLRERLFALRTAGSFRYAPLRSLVGLGNSLSSCQAQGRTLAPASSSFFDVLQRRFSARPAATLVDARTSAGSRGALTPLRLGRPFLSSTPSRLHPVYRLTNSVRGATNAEVLLEIGLYLLMLVIRPFMLAANLSALLIGGSYFLLPKIVGALAPSVLALLGFYGQGWLAGWSIAGRVAIALVGTPISYYLAVAIGHIIFKILLIPQIVHEAIREVLKESSGAKARRGRRF